MNPLYQALPVFAQNVACSAAGWWRGRQRFTPHFWQTLAEWEKSISFPLEELHRIQANRLCRLIEHARRHVPALEHLPPLAIGSDPASCMQRALSQIEPSQKSDYRSRERDYLARNIAPRSLIRARTSGTTGSALRLWYTADALAEEYATVWRMRRRAGVSLSDAHLTFGGRMIVPYSRRSPPFWRHDWSASQTLFSLYHMSPSTMMDYVDAIHSTPGRYVQGYPSSLHLIARALLHENRPLPPGRLVAVFTSSESVLDYQRAVIERAFGAPIFDRYGASEFSASMTACPVGNLHVDMEYCIVEIETLEETSECLRGPILVTGLSNLAMPFIRYRIGDVGTKLKAPCSCGRAGDVFASIDGRIEDYVETPDGRVIGRLDHIFKQMDSVAEAQIIQERADRILLLVVPSGTWTERQERKLLVEVQRRLGSELAVDVRTVDSIPRQPNGKFRAVKSYIRERGIPLRLAEERARGDERMPDGNPLSHYLIGDHWTSGFLDEHREGGDVRIQVLGTATCAPVEGVYFIRSPSFRRAWAQLNEVGPIWLARKIASRFSESRRNRRYLSVGIGEVIDPPRSEDRWVVFIAPGHARGMSRIVLPKTLTRPWKPALPSGLSEGSMRIASTASEMPGAEQIVGWSKHSGRQLSEDTLRNSLLWATEEVMRIPWDRCLKYEYPLSKQVCEAVGTPRTTSLPSAVLFGYGHYARTIVLSGVDGRLNVRAVHEIDPTLIPRHRRGNVRWETSPLPRSNERYDAYLIASFHHTHTPLAIHALHSGAAAIVEKPVAMDRAQTAMLVNAIDETSGRFFACFHKRYSPLNEIALRDLGIRPGSALDYHCIVFEEPLPTHHWYRWPNSHSRILSNGCHWIDHFLFLNGWSPPKQIQVACGGPGLDTANISMRLENGAFFSMILTDVGSGRIGVREHVELRSGAVTVSIEDGSTYVSEDGARVVRRRRINKMSSYERMYQEIANRVSHNLPGDSSQSVRVSCDAIISVEEAYMAKRVREPEEGAS